MADSASQEVQNVSGFVNVLGLFARGNQVSCLDQSPTAVEAFSVRRRPSDGFFLSILAPKPHIYCRARKDTAGVLSNFREI